MARNKWGRQEEGGQGGTSFEDLGYQLFDATRTAENPYEIGDVVIYNGSLYKFTAAHTGPWTGSDATDTSVEELVKEKADAIKVLTREAQNLTPAEKAQVLENIGAIGEDDTLMTINGTGVKKGDAVTTAETAIVVDGEMSDSSQNPVQNKVVKEYVDELQRETFYDDTLYVSDSQGNVIAKIDANGIESVAGIFPNLGKNQWNSRSIAVFGDSVVAACNGDNSLPYGTTGRNWAMKVAKFLNIKNCYGRGIGGQRFLYMQHGGSLSWCDNDGNYANIGTGYNYDDYLNPETQQSVLSAIEALGYDSSRHTLVRGALSSWLRIKTMFPSEIKDSIDAVLVMAHNDTSVGYQYLNAELSFAENSTEDLEWSQSDEYATYGGDYNINDSVRGAIASTVMKMQAWMPDAVIVLLTPISGLGTAGELNVELTSGMTNVADRVCDIHKLMAIPLVDCYATCGINGLNRTTYIQDAIHPNEAGAEMLARAVCAGLINIYPKNCII